MSEPWRIEVLGGLHATSGTEAITRFRTRKFGSLLGFLACFPGRAHSREELIERIWPETESESGRNNLRMALSSLRRQLEPPGSPAGSVLLADRAMVRLTPGSFSTDLHDLEIALASARRAEVGLPARASLERAAALYRGPLLAGYYEDWVQAERGRVQDLLLDALLQLAELYRSAGDLSLAIDTLRRGLAEDELFEPAHRELIRLYQRAGQGAAAARQTAELQRLLRGDARGPTSSSAAPAVLGQSGCASDRPDTAAAPQSTGGGAVVTYLLCLGDALGDAAWDAIEELTRSDGLEVREREEGSILAACSGVGDAARTARNIVEASGGLRCAVHCAEQVERDTEPLRLLAALAAAAPVGSVVCTDGAAALLGDRRDVFPASVLGFYRLPGVREPVRVHSLLTQSSSSGASRVLNLPRARSGNLPAAGTGFYGREELLSALCDLLRPNSGARLVTLLGPGGIGKTRLAIEVCRGLMEHYEGEVWFVPLADTRDAESVVSRIAAAIGLPRSEAEIDSDGIAAFLEDRPCLMLLDNLEQMAEAAGPIMAAMTERLPSVSFLVTSRQALEIAPEQRIYVEPLPLADPEQPLAVQSRSPSMRLFLERARAVRPDFQLSQANVRTLGDLCARLEGIPLALEITAARVGACSPAQILAGLEDRLGFVVSRRRDLPERHRSLRAALEWSFALLDPDTANVVSRVAVFRGGWTAAAAAAVCGAPDHSGTHAVEAMERLIACSLVIRPTCADGVEPRFHLLETIREFAWERLSSGERQLLHARHLQWCAALVGALSPLTGPEQHERIAALELEHDNLTQALDWAVRQTDDNALAALKLCSNLRLFWYTRGYHRESLRIIDAALAATVDAPPLPVAAALQARAQVLDALGHVAEAEAVWLDSIAQFRRSDQPQEASRSVAGLGYGKLKQGKHDEAERLLKEALSLTDPDCPAPRLTILLMLGDVARARGEHQAAEALYAEGLEICLLEGSGLQIGFAYHDLAEMARLQGRPADSRARHRECLASWRAIGYSLGLANTLICVAALACDEGAFDLAAPLLRAADLELRRTGARLDPVEEDVRHETAARLSLRPELAPTDGRTLTFDEALDAAEQWV